MSEGAQAGPTPPPTDPGVDLAALRERGADGFDPVRFRFIEALAGRASACRGEARRLLDGKLSKALAEYGERFEQARREAGETIARMAEKYPEAVGDLERIFRAGDFGGLRRAIAELDCRCRRAPLAELLTHVAGGHGPESGEGYSANDAETNIAPVAELKSLRYFRDTWSKLSADQQLSQAMAQGPENAGPLNSHRLVLQSLKLMRDISPDYLNRFMSYADALLWLDQANGTGAPMARNAPRGEVDKKRKSGRAR